MKLSKLVVTLAVGALLATATALRADSTATNNPSGKLISYPQKTCPVSGDKLGSMDKPYVFVYQGQEIKLCCADCKKDFLKDPQKYIQKIKDEVAQAGK